MPFYEGIGLIAEKNAVVIDVGSAYTKVGYAGEAAPRTVIATPPELHAWRRPPVADDELYDALVRFVHQIYFRHLLVNPKDRRVVLVDALLGPVRFKEVLSRVLFKHFEVLSVLYSPSPLMPLLTLGVQTALVVDVGFAEVTVVPVFEGVPVLKAWQAQPMASEAVHGAIRELLAERGTVRIGDGGSGDAQRLADVQPSMDISDEVIEDIKVRLCFTTNLGRGQQIQSMRRDASSVSGLSSFLKSQKSVPSVSYPLGGDAILDVDGAVRESACEAMFEQDEDCLSVSTAVLDALLASPVDTRRPLARNLVIVGGTSMIPGFKTRLVEEMRDLLASPKHKYQDSLHIDDILAHKLPCKANYAAWTGASLFGATDAITTRSFTRDAFLKEGGSQVPDWCNLRFNSLVVSDRQG